MRKETMKLMHASFQQPELLSFCFQEITRAHTHHHHVTNSLQDMMDEAARKVECKCSTVFYHIQSSNTFFSIYCSYIFAQ